MLRTFSTLIGTQTTPIDANFYGVAIPLGQRNLFVFIKFSERPCSPRRPRCHCCNVCYVTSVIKQTCL